AVDAATGRELDGGCSATEVAGRHGPVGQGLFFAVEAARMTQSPRRTQFRAQSPATPGVQRKTRRPRARWHLGIVVPRELYPLATKRRRLRRVRLDPECESGTSHLPLRQVQHASLEADLMLFQRR